MRQSPLVQTLAALSGRERREFRLWVQSPAFNRRPGVLQLYDWICTQLAAEGWAKADACAALSLDDARLRHNMSYLFAVLKQYLAWREWSAGEAQHNRYLCRALRKKGLLEVFEKEFKPAEKPLDEVVRNADFYLQRYQMYFEQWEAQHRAGRTEGVPLVAADAAFGNFVAIAALRHGCAALDQPGRSTAGLPAWLPQTLQAVEAGLFADVPAVQVYYHCYKIMEAGAEGHFQALRALLAGQTALLPAQELRDVYLVGINFCIKKLNTGARAYIREALELYRIGLERRVIQDNGALSKATYQNILLLALALEEWAWARNFLETYRSALPSGERHNTYHFNLALFYFRKKDYEAAQEILRRVEFRDVYHNLDARRMLVRIYFDTDALAALEALLHSFRIYLQRHRNIGYHRDLNANFVRAVQRLLNLEPGDETKKNRLRRRITEEAYLAEREWLLEKLVE